MEIVGGTGALLVLDAYVGVSTGRLSGTSVAFRLMNAIAAWLAGLRS